MSNTLTDRLRAFAHRKLESADKQRPAGTTEFPIVVIAGTPVGGFGALTQLYLDGQVTRRVFGPF